MFHEQMSALKEGGVDCFLLETFGDLAEIAQAVRAARAVDPSIPVIAQMTVGVDGRTSYGATPEDLARTLDRLDVDVFGLNCSVGPQAILEAIEKMAAASLIRFAPNVFVSRTSAPDFAYAACTSRTRSGAFRLSSS